MTRRTKTYAIIISVATTILILFVAYDQYRRDKRNHPATKPTPIVSQSPATSPASPTLAELQAKIQSDLNELKAAQARRQARDQSLALAAENVLAKAVAQKRPIAASDEPRQCTYPEPSQPKSNVMSFGGDRIGLSCWTVPRGMIAVITAPGIFYNSPVECKDGIPTLARLPCRIVKDNRTITFTRCLKSIEDATVIGGHRFEVDPTCQWERERYQ